MNNIPKNYSTVKISTETFNNFYGIDQLGFSEIRIVKTACKKIKQGMLGNSACL
jgi:hypothetical protein